MPFIFDSNKKFVSLTYKFNIFNLSITCNKFFDIVFLFLKNYSSTQRKDGKNIRFFYFNVICLAKKTTFDLPFKNKNIKILNQKLRRLN